MCRKLGASNSVLLKRFCVIAPSQQVSGVQDFICVAQVQKESEIQLIHLVWHESKENVRHYDKRPAAFQTTNQQQHSPGRCGEASALI